MRAVGAFLVRDALDSIYARAMTLQIRACCSAELHGRPALGHKKLNASALQALACHRCTLFGGV